MRKIKFILTVVKENGYVFSSPIFTLDDFENENVNTWRKRNSAHDDKLIHKRQFTGLLDKSGKEIYEGQEIKSPENHLRGYVEFHAGAFSLKITMSANRSFDVGQSIALYNFDNSALEITERNICENPKLLK